MKVLKDYGFSTSNKFYTIAEIGINHGGSEDLAKKLIDSAARAGADSVKFQTYITEKRTQINTSIFDILKKCELPFETFEVLKEHAEDQGLEFFSTPFDDESVQCLDDIGVKIFKVASFDVVNQKLLKRIAETRKTIIMSIGMANANEIQHAYRTLKEKTDRIVLLHCITAYPTNEIDANLAVINTLKNEYKCVIGHSDHTNDIQVPLFAAAMGAQVLEKHYKIDADMDCIDAPVSITEEQFSVFCKKIKHIENILGQPNLKSFDIEKETMQYRRRS